MHKQWIQASGYLSIFLMPALLFTGTLLDRPWLAFGAAIFVFPLARLAFGALPASGVPEWREGVATALDRLPVIYVPILAACALAGLGAAPDRMSTSPTAWLGLGLSLWMTQLFATCVAHELIHRRDKRQALLGHLLAGFCGYPALGLEHLAHHGRPGSIELAEVPAKSESMWRFTARRLSRIGNELLGRHSPIWNWGIQLPGVVRTRAAMASTLVTAMACAAMTGWRGLCLYVGVAFGVSFGIQLITFIQHWGLGEQDIGSRVGYGRGWEEDCQFQAWVTLSISIHDRHHRDSRMPFYRLALTPDSPRLPASYVLLMFASMVPPVWQRVMQQAHSHWMERPGDPLSAGRRLTCFGLNKG